MEEPKTVRNAGPSIWESCHHCPNLHFSSQGDFERHLRTKHAFAEGSITLCTYGINGICSTLQFGDLTLDGYKCHVKCYHASKDSSKDWSLYLSSQNLPAVLNDPYRGKQSNLFTKTWGDDFVEKTDIATSPYLPDINFTHFEHYCKKIIKRYRRHCRLRQLCLNSKPRLPSVSEESCKVPNIFYQPKLSLNIAETFNSVFPHLVDSPDIANSIRELQENLSNYLDVIEMKISKQVARKSDAFFHAMLSHDTIMEQMASALKQVRKTRHDLGESQKCLTTHPMKLICLSTNKQNMEKVYEKLKLMVTVQQTQPMIQLLLSTSDYVAALDLIASTQSVLSTQLAGIHAFRHLSPQLTEMERLIDKMLTNEFQRHAVADLNRSLSDLKDMPERDKLTCIVSGIIRLKELEFIDAYKSEAITTIQATVKQAMIEIMCERDESVEIVLKSSNADNITLGHNEGVLFLEKVTPSLLIIMKRVTELCGLIQSVSQMEDLITIQNDDILSKDDQSKIEDKLQKMITSLTDYCNEKCANVIFPKNDKNNFVTNLNQITLFSQLVEGFTSDLGNITGASNNSLKLSFRSYSMKYLQNLHNERKHALTLSLNNDKWRSAEVSNELQIILESIYRNNEIPLDVANESVRHHGKYLVINKEHYAVASSVQILISIVFEYCRIAKKIPINVNFVMHCLIELIRHYNSRSCQLVLGAEALQTAGLKTISTANLALLSRSLHIILWLLPAIHNTLKSVCTSDVSLHGFETLEKDIRKHEQEIENKIYLIVSNLLASQLTGWDARPPVPSQTFRNISKHLVKLHEALSNILPLQQIQHIYKRVHDNFKDKLREQLLKMNIVANGGPQHGVVTSELTFYLQTLKTLQVITESELDDKILYDVW